MMTNARFSYRVLAMILAFLMILTSVPVVAFADEGTGTTVTDPSGTTNTNPSGSQNSGTGSTTTPVEPGKTSDLEALLKDGGSVTLDRDYEIDREIVITKDTDIELNGHKITRTTAGSADAGYYVFVVGVWVDQDSAENVAPTVSIRDSSAARTGTVVSQTGVLSLVHGILNVESGYYVAAASQPVLRLDSKNPEPTDRLNVYGGRFDGGLPQTFDGRFLIYGGMFDNPNVANILINSIFKVRSFVTMDGKEYYAVSVGVSDSDKEEISEWYLDEQEEMANLGISADLIIENIKEYMWFARLVAEGSYEYTDVDGVTHTIYANDDVAVLVADITFGTEFEGVTYDMYVPIGSERAPFEGYFYGDKNFLNANTGARDYPTIDVPEIINAINAGIFGYVVDATIQGVNVHVGEIKNIANIMGEDNINKLSTSSGVLVGTAVGDVTLYDVGATSGEYTLIGVVAENATVTIEGPTHAVDAEGKDVAPAYGYIDTAELYAQNLGEVEIKGGFFSFELKKEEVTADYIRTREDIDKAKVYNTADEYWYSIAPLGNYVALLNNTEAGDYGYFETLQAAIDAADDAHMLIEILADINDEDVVIAEDDSVIIYFFGYDHTASITVNGELELVATNGYIDTIVNNGVLTIDVTGATFDSVTAKTGSTTLIVDGIFADFVKETDATVVIAGGFFKQMTKDTEGYIITDGFFTDAAKPLPQMVDGANGYAVVVNHDDNTKDEYPWTVRNTDNEAKLVLGDEILVFEFIEEALDYLKANAADLDGAVITLLKAADIEEGYELSADIAYTIDLGGYTLSSRSIVFDITAGNVTIKNGTIAATVDAIFLNNLTSGKAVTLSLTDDLAIVTETGAGITLLNGAAAMTLNTAADITVEGELAAIVGFASTIGAGTVINVTGGKIDAAKVGIAHGQVGTLNITNVEIVAGETGIQVTGGTVVITNATVSTVDGNAIDVRYVGNAIDVEINGGVFNSEKANAFEFSQMSRAIPEVTLAINGGTFDAPVVSNGVYGFVTGGLFVEIARNLVAAGLARSDAPNAEGYYYITDDVEAYLIDAVSGDYIGYQFLETAIYDAAHGATVYIAKDLSDKDADGAYIVVTDPADPSKTIIREASHKENHISYSIVLDKCVSITSYDPNNTGVKYTLENISFDLLTYKEGTLPAGHDANDIVTVYSFTNLKFVGNSHIHYHKQEGESNLTIDNCDANVIGGAFLFAWDAMGVVADDYELLLTLTFTNNTVLATDANNQYNYAVELQVVLCDGSVISGNTFGAEAAPYTETFVFKAYRVQTAAQNGGVRAVIEVMNNTVYMKNENRAASAFEFAGESEFLMLGQTNKIVCLNTAPAEGQLPYRIAMYAIGQNGIVMDLKDGNKQSTINDVPLTLQNVYYQPGQEPKYVGILVELTTEDRWNETLGITEEAVVICGGIFDFVTVEINENLARNYYLLETAFATGYRNMGDYVGYVVTKVLGEGTLNDPYVIPNDFIMDQVLFSGVEDGAYYVVGEGVDADKVAQFVEELNDGIDEYSGATNVAASVIRVYWFTTNYEGFEEDTYVKYGYKTLAESLTDADGRVVVLMTSLDKATVLGADATENTLTITDVDTVINLDGYDIDFEDAKLVINGGMIRFRNLNVVPAFISFADATWANALITVENEGGLMIEEDVALIADAPYAYAVALKTGSGLNVDGVIVAEGTAVYNDGGHVTINSTALVQSFAQKAIAIKQAAGTTLLNGGEIYGSITINGGDLIVLYGHVSNANGNAIEVIQKTDDDVIFVDIRGGIFEGSDYALIEDNQNYITGGTANVTMTLTGGVFFGKIAAVSCLGFINDYDVYFVDDNYDELYVNAYGSERDATYMPHPSYFGLTADGVQLARTFDATIIDVLGNQFYAWHAEDAVALYVDIYGLESYYSTMFEALNNIYIYGNDTDAYTVTMIDDSVETLGIAVKNGHTVTIDLSGYTVSLDGDAKGAYEGGVYADTAASLTIENGTLTIGAGVTADGLMAPNSSLTLTDVVFNGQNTMLVHGTVTLEGVTTYTGDMIIMPCDVAADGTNATLNVNDEAVTVNGDILVAWNVECYLPWPTNKTGKAVLNISEGIFNGTVRLRDADETYIGTGVISENGFVGNITGGYFAFPNDNTYKPNNMLCAQGNAFAVSDVALPETLVTESGRTTYYTIVEAVAEAEFYTVMTNDDDATVWVGFATLEEALEALSDTGKVRLVDDLTLDEIVDVDITDTIIFTLENYTLTMNEGAWIELSNDYHLILINGTVDAYGAAFKVSDDAYLDVSNVTINGAKTGSYEQVITLATGATVVIVNSTVYAEGYYAIGDDMWSEATDTMVGLGKDAVVKSDYSGAIRNVEALALTAGSTVISEGITIMNVETVMIDDAVVTGETAISMNNGALVISGENTKITGTNCAISGNPNSWNDDELTILILGGEINGGFAVVADEDATLDVIIENFSYLDDQGNTVYEIPVFTGYFECSDTQFITGGAFRYENEDGDILPGILYEHLVIGYWPVYNTTDGYYYVEDKGVDAIAEAEVLDADGNVYVVYVATLDEAMTTVGHNLDVNMFRDAIETFKHLENKVVFLNMNGYTITVTDPAVIGAGATLYIEDGIITAIDGVDTTMIVEAYKSAPTGIVVLGEDVAVTGNMAVYGKLQLTYNATVENVALDIADRQTTNAYLMMYSTDAMVTDTVTVSRTNPYRNAGVPYIDMTAGNIYKIALGEHTDPEIYVDEKYSYDLEAGANMITGGNIGIATSEEIVELFVAKGYSFGAFTTKYTVYDANAGVAEGETPAPMVVFTDLLVGSGLAMKAYLANVADTTTYKATVNGYATELVANEENGMVYANIPISALQVTKTFTLALTDAEGNEVMSEDICFVEAADELIKAGDEDVVNLLYAIYNYTMAFTDYFNSDDYETWSALNQALEGTAYEDGARNEDIVGMVEDINGVATYTILGPEAGDVLTTTRAGSTTMKYTTYGRVGVTPNVIFNDKFDLVLDFKFEKADMTALDLANFTATVTSEEAGFTPVDVAVVKATNAKGETVLRVVFEDISTMDLDVNYTVTLNTVDNSGKVEYTMSIASYMAERMQNDADSTYVNLMQALYLYYKAAEPFDADDIEIKT